MSLASSHASAALLAVRRYKARLTRAAPRFPLAMAPKLGAGVAGLWPCKRYIATHDANGKSVYAEAPEQVFSGAMSRSYSIGSVPAVLADEADIKAYKAESGVTSYRTPGIVPPQPGANLVVVDLAPGAQSLMHRTVSIDFSICVIGEIDHELDGGAKVRLQPGDHIIQRGTMHRWSNPTDQPARFVACAIPCVPFDIAGQQLKEMHLPNKPRSKL